jgi:acetyltransferase-like isoleucine patch superfamily enzyme
MSEIRQVPQTELQSSLTDARQSAYRKYQNLVIGRPGLWNLIKYELITGLFGGLSGALGFALRKVFYPRLFGSCGPGVVFGRQLTIRHPHKIRLGENCVIDDLCVLDAKGEANDGIRIGNNVILARNTVVSCKGGNITIGDNSNISLNCMIHSESNVEIGRNNLWAAYCYIIGGGQHDFERTDIPVIQQGSTAKGIVLEDNIWLGAGVKVMDGVRIGHDAIIGIASVVHRDLPPMCVALGMPARVAHMRKQT